MRMMKVGEGNRAGLELGGTTMHLRQEMNKGSTNKKGTSSFVVSLRPKTPKVSGDNNNIFNSNNNVNKNNSNKNNNSNNKQQKNKQQQQQ
jgi:hypothetical protein